MSSFVAIRQELADCRFNRIRTVGQVSNLSKPPRFNSLSFVNCPLDRLKTCPTNKSTVCPRCKRFLTADRAMHKTLLTVADNWLAWNIVHNGRIQTLIFGLHTYERDLSHIAFTLRSHGRVLRAIKQRDGASARRWMETHIRHSMRDVLRAHDRQVSVDNLGSSREEYAARDVG